MTLRIRGVQDVMGLDSNQIYSKAGYLQRSCLSPCIVESIFVGSRKDRGSGPATKVALMLSTSMP